MLIDSYQNHYGAALIQIAEHPRFTAINPFKVKGSRSRSAFRINDDRCVYLKYCSKPLPKYGEYIFTFERRHLDELRTISKNVSKVVLALICVKDQQICAIEASDFYAMRTARIKAGGSTDNLTVCAHLPAGKSFRVYVNQPNRRGVMLGKPKIVPRKAFPSIVF